MVYAWPMYRYGVWIPVTAVMLLWRALPGSDVNFGSERER